MSLCFSPAKALPGFGCDGEGLSKLDSRVTVGLTGILAGGACGSLGPWARSMLPESVPAGDSLCVDMARETKQIFGCTVDHWADVRDGDRKEIGVGKEVGKEMGKEMGEVLGERMGGSGKAR